MGGSRRGISVVFFVQKLHLENNDQPVNDIYYSKHVNQVSKTVLSVQFSYFTPALLLSRPADLQRESLRQHLRGLPSCSVRTLASDISEQVCSTAGLVLVTHWL